MEELVKKYSELQRIIYRVALENKNREDDFIDEIDQMIMREEEFAIELENFLLDLQEDK